MKTRVIKLCTALLAFGVFSGCSPTSATSDTQQSRRGALTLSPNAAVAQANDASSRQAAEQSKRAEFPLNLSDAQWRQRLTPAQYHVLREEGTERAFSGEYDKHDEPGVYNCAACDHPLFSSQTKFDSRTGWPSFYQPISADNIATSADHKLRSKRTEVHCANCGGHLGHVFRDGPKPTGLRYCVNSVALKFEAAGE
ncbi:MAG: peptide-methionine (R)-S-oxide reductase MsrB [Bradymonadaceae bacterium]|nr:peptide-methionine (R)-S-oxide reductase MsrB [Lujinxingiaceae bacterium]